MIKRFVDFNRESFEEIKEFFLELIDENCEFEEWTSESILIYPSENIIKKFKHDFNDVCFVTLKINITSPNKKISIDDSQRIIQRFLNKFGLGILILLPCNVDISYIDYRKFFNSDGIQFIERASGFRLSFVTWRTSADYTSSKVSCEIGMVFVR